MNGAVRASRIGAEAVWCSKFAVSFAPAVESAAVAPTTDRATPPPGTGDGVGLARPREARALPLRLVGWARRHPDLTLVFLLLLVGGALRLAFAFRSPPLFVGGDSQTYLVPGYELA